MPRVPPTPRFRPERERERERESVGIAKVAGNPEGVLRARARVIMIFDSSNEGCVPHAGALCVRMHSASFCERREEIKGELGYLIIGWM